MNLNHYFIIFGLMLTLPIFGLVHVQEKLILNTPFIYPLSSKDQQAVVDLVVNEALHRIDYTMKSVRLRAVRALINANLGIDDGDLLRVSHLSELYSNLIQVSEWSNVISNKSQLKIECRFEHKDGKIIWAFVQTDIVVNKLNEIVGFVGTITDITNRKRIENVLKVLAAGSSGLQFDQFLVDALSQLSDLFQCRYVSLSGLSTDGISSTTLSVLDNKKVLENYIYQLAGTPCVEVVIREKNIVLTDIASLYPTDKILINMSIDSYIGTQLVNSDGMVIGILAVMDNKEIVYENWMESVIDLFSVRMSIELQRDLVSKNLFKQHANLEELVVVRTAELEVALEHANNAKSEFLSRMSYELRTPMNAILGFAQILELDSDELKQDHQNNVNEILNAGSHLLELINEVLDLAKIESGKVEVLQEDVPIKDILQQCLSLISTAAAKKGIKIIDNIYSKNDVVTADFIRLKQVISNILSNAVKYNEMNGSIVIDSEVMDGSIIRINITNTGKGISDIDIGKLFTSFERLDEANNIEGTGIGLVITKHLVELMNGSIGVSSEINKGTTFWVEFELSSGVAVDTNICI